MGEMLGKMISECELFIQKRLKESADGVKKYNTALDECIALKIPFPVYNIDGKIWPKDFFPDKPIVNTYGELFLWMFDKNGIRRYPKNVIDPDAGTYIDPVTGKDVLNEMYRVKVPPKVQLDNDTDDEGKSINKVSVDESIDRIYTLLNRYEDEVSTYKQWSKALEIGSEKFSNLVLDTILSRVSGDYIKSNWTKSTIYDHWYDGFQGKLSYGSEIGVIDIIGRQYPIEQNIYGGTSWLFIEMPWKTADGAVYNALIERINNVAAPPNATPAVAEPTVPVVAEPTSAPIPTPKIKLNIVGIEDGFQIMAKEDIPDFKIYVGDIPIEDDPNRSNDYDTFGLDDEYLEDAFVGDEEKQLALDSFYENSESEGEETGIEPSGGSVEPSGESVESSGAKSSATSGSAGAISAGRTGIKRFQQKLILNGVELINGDLPSEYLVNIPFNPAFKLDKNAAKKLDELNSAYKKKFGINLEVSSAYRTFESQNVLFDWDYFDKTGKKCVKADGWSKGRPGKGTTAAAKPGVSKHGWGQAVDIQDLYTKGVGWKETGRWLNENAAAYGWINPDWAKKKGTPNHEPWHWEYILPDLFRQSV